MWWACGVCGGCADLGWVGGWDRVTSGERGRGARGICPTLRAADSAHEVRTTSERAADAEKH
eukprot:2845494-Pleurochrysis_carterae.AAC.2